MQNNNFACASHFFVHFFPILHDYDVEMLKFLFYRERKQTTTTIYFSFWAWIWSLEIQLHEGLADIWESKWVGIIKTERTEIHFLSDVVLAVASLDLLKSLSWSNDADVNEDVKKIMGFRSKTTTWVVRHRLFVHFVPLFARLQRENA